MELGQSSRRLQMRFLEFLLSPVKTLTMITRLVSDDNTAHVGTCSHASTAIASSRLSLIPQTDEHCRICGYPCNVFFLTSDQSQLICKYCGWSEVFSLDGNMNIIKIAAFRPPIKIGDYVVRTE